MIQRASVGYAGIETSSNSIPFKYSYPYFEVLSSFKITYLRERWSKSKRSFCLSMFDVLATIRDPRKKTNAKHESRADQVWSINREKKERDQEVPTLEPRKMKTGRWLVLNLFKDCCLVVFNTPRLPCSPCLSVNDEMLIQPRNIEIFFLLLVSNRYRRPKRKKYGGFTDTVVTLHPLRRAPS